VVFRNQAGIISYGRSNENACQIALIAAIGNVRIEARNRETLGSEFTPPCDALYAHFGYYTI